ncbi:MAG: phosphodiesterase [Nocardioidaceae bacterium]|nr:phosphodiesterase [Nocardioidaceae bacterium]
MRDSTVQHRAEDGAGGLLAAIDRVGYYPAVVTDAVESALAGEPVLSYVIHHEPTFDRDEVRRHVTVLVLTPTRVLLTHTDEHPPDDLLPAPYASTSTEAVPLSRIGSVAVTRMVANPAESAERGEPAVAEAVLTVGWGAVQRVDLEPAACSDPECTADHGYSGVLTAEDFAVRISASADGVDAVASLLDFSRALSEATVGR